MVEVGFVIGMAGHVDHGKSSVIKALTGITTARYREEIEREITIDIGFAHIQIEGVGPVSIIDVPGHEDFVHNMLAGIFGARLALLVIATNEGIMPQTVEHFDILTHCGVSKIVVVLNKADLAAGYDIEYRKMEIEDFLKGTKFENSKIIEFSSNTKTGAEKLIAAIKEEITAINRPAAGNADESLKTVLYPVDRVFEKPGFGQILTGTIIEGRLKIDQTVSIMPDGECKIRAIESHSRKLSEIGGNSRAALNITRTRDAEIKRGSFLVSPEIASLYKVLTVKLTAVKNLRHPVKSGTRIKFYFYSACYAAKLRLLDTAVLEAGKDCFAQIILSEPDFALIFKPFIIRTHTDEETIGGGIILNCSTEFVKNKKAVLNGVSIFSQNKGEPAPAFPKLLFNDHMSRLGYMEVAAACAAFKTLKAKIADTVTAEAGDDKYRVIKERFLTGEKAFGQTTGKILNALAAHLNSNSLVSAVSRAELIGLCVANPKEADTAFYSYAIDALISDGRLKSADGSITPATREKSDTAGALDKDSEIIKRKILKLFDSEPLTPKTLDDAKAGVAKNQIELFNKVVKFLESEKIIRKIFENYYITSTQSEKYIAAIKEILAQKPSFTVIDFKDKTALSRKYAVAILEFFDRTGVTARKDNDRQLK